MFVIERKERPKPKSKLEAFAYKTGDIFMGTIKIIMIAPFVAMLGFVFYVFISVLLF